MILRSSGGERPLENEVHKCLFFIICYNVVWVIDKTFVKLHEWDAYSNVHPLFIFNCLFYFFLFPRIRFLQKF